MKYMKTIVSVILFFTLTAHASVTEGGRGMLFGNDHAFAVTAISAWVLDNKSGVKQGLHMVFYPKGESWRKSPVIIYGRAVPTSEAATLREQVDNTVKDFHRNGSPAYSAKAQAPLTLGNGQDAAVYHFSGDQWGNYEAAVYFQEVETINYLVFNARNKAMFEQYLGDFYRIASSYQNLYSPATALGKEKLAVLKKESNTDLVKPGGKDYESKAMRAIGKTMSGILRDCTLNMREKELPAFSYFVRINNDGKAGESYIFPSNALSTCFKGLMTNTKYPEHDFGTFLFNIEMKFSP